MTTVYFVALAVTYLVNAAYFVTKLVTHSANREESRDNLAGATEMQTRCCR